MGRPDGVGRTPRAETSSVIQAGAAGDEEGELRAADLGEPAREEPAERRKTRKCEEVEAEHAAAEVIRRRQLESDWLFAVQSVKQTPTT